MTAQGRRPYSWVLWMAVIISLSVFAMACGSSDSLPHQADSLGDTIVSQVPADRSLVKGSWVLSAVDGDFATEATSFHVVIDESAPECSGAIVLQSQGENKVLGGFQESSNTFQRCFVDFERELEVQKTMFRESLKTLSSVGIVDGFLQVVSDGHIFVFERLSL